MRKITSLAAALLNLLLVTMVPVAVEAAEIEGVTFEDRLLLDGQDFELHGTGLLRYRVFFRGFVAALYLEDELEGNAAVSAVLEDRPRRIEIEYFWPIPAREFVRATLEGIQENTRAEAFRRVRPRMVELNRLYRDVEAGDRYSLTYVPGRGTELALNGQRLGVVEGAEFSSALFSVWVGRQPFDTGLREQLLARKRRPASRRPLSRPLSRQ